MAGAIRKRRVAVARIWHEANSFNPVATLLSDFQRREWTRGAEALRSGGHTATEIGGLARFVGDRPHWDVTVSRCTSAPPGGPVAADACRAITQEILADLREEEWDGVYVSLHGAMVAADDLSPDHTFLKAVRAAVGPDPILAVSMDMHACIDPAVAAVADIMSGYRTYPHVDMAETAMRCLEMMEEAFETGVRPELLLRRVPFLPLSHGMRTDKGPMRDLVDQAIRERDAGSFADVSLFGGFAYADTPNAGATVAITHVNRLEADAAAKRLSEAMLRRRGDFEISLPDARSALADAIRSLDDGAAGPIAIVDGADNPLSGGIGDTTELFGALMEMDGSHESVFAFFHDPDLVALAHDRGVGSALTCRLGGRLTEAYGEPVSFSGVVERLTDGRFCNRGPMEHGREIDLGRTAVLRAGPTRVVLCETCQSANDPAWCDLHGIDLARVGLFVVKAKNHFRAGFEDVCTRIIDVDCPGPAPVNRALLPYKHVDRSYWRSED